MSNFVVTDNVAPSIHPHFKTPYQVITHRDEAGSEVIRVHRSVLLLQLKAKFQVNVKI